GKPEKVSWSWKSKKQGSESAGAEKNGHLSAGKADCGRSGGSSYRPPVLQTLAERTRVGRLKRMDSRLLSVGADSWVRTPWCERKRAYHQPRISSCPARGA